MIKRLMWLDLKKLLCIFCLVHDYSLEGGSQTDCSGCGLKHKHDVEISLLF